ncbi:beta galactosidase jelly roll domain-containing protein [Tamlana fucoidanivorans]|uniref:Glycoside hydrolase family 2 protein n=1 Tax=Allotamlana fucoidanivorans TaxID=2583814 RepID=A0A5C4SNT6_9FLAO|nr:sugar-binding domain-containing protein [Tamlana fucoidanivorans]TNJ45841.1 glycoside hydrolase family 2 protein [Tamlana fucoidanivorans]
MLTENDLKRLSSMAHEKTLFCFYILLITFNISFTQNPQFSTAGFYPVEGSNRKVYNFNPGWRFYKGDIENAYSIGFDDSNWLAANLPHGLEILPENASGGRNYQGIAWYRKEFQVKKDDLQDKMYIYFEAVMGVAKVWVNGQQVAEHYGGYLPFVVDISEIVTTGKNVIAVMADNSDSKLYPPGKNQSGLDFSYFGGIYRDVYFIKTNPTHVTFKELSHTEAGGGVFVGVLDIKDNSAKIEVRTEIVNASKRSQDIIVKTILENQEQKKLKTITQKIKLKPNETKQLVEELVAKNVRLWHPEDPYLHFIKTEIIVDGKQVDQLRTRFGIRLYEMKGAEGLFINKKPIGKKLIGVNRHQDYMYVGNALPNSAHYRDVKLLREGGSHIVRVGHYPQDDAFYDACDELGMITTTANPGWHFFNFKEQIFEERLYEDSRNLVRKDRNRPSILLWETALNETPSQPGHVMNNMHKAAHAEYPFPGMYTVTDYEEAKKGGLDVYYHGYDTNINSFNREFGDGNEVDDWYSQNSIVRVKREWGEKAMLDQSLRQAERLAERYLTGKVRIGAAMWAGIDHQRGYHPDPFWGGHLNVARLPRYTYYLYQSQNDPNYKIKGTDKVTTGPMIYITNELTQLSPSDVVIFSNCDEVQLTWLGKDYGMQKPSRDDKYKGLPHPPFIFKNVFSLMQVTTRGPQGKKELPKMIVKGFIEGKEITEEVKVYAQRSEKLKLCIDAEGLDLVANGSDFIPVRATIVDKNGTKKVLAEDYVYFEVEGPAEVIGGISNMANPAKSSFGIATALIKTTLKSGSIKVRAYVDGLESDEITLESKPTNLPLYYYEEYMNNSKKQNLDIVVIEQKQEENLPTDVKELQEELKKLKLELVGKTQALMELRNNPKGE